MRVIIVTLEAPLPFGNPAAREVYMLLKELTARGHRVTVFAACGEASQMGLARDIFPHPRYDLRLYPFPGRAGLFAKAETILFPFSYMFNKELINDLNCELVRGFDVLHLTQLPAGWLGFNHASKSLVGVHFLYAIDLAEARVRRVQRWLMGRFERTVLRRYRNVSALTERLASAARVINPRAAVHVVPLGIDVSLYPYIPDEARNAELVVSVIGNMGWYPSHSAAVRLLSRLWPEIHRRVPAAQVRVIGWKARETLSQFLGAPGVTIEENVPDVRPYFEQTCVLLYAPQRGSGMKVKVMEAFALGVPVVTTTEGVEGIPAVDGVHAGICDDDEGLIDRTVHLLNNTAQQNRQRLEARSLIESTCGPTPVLDALELVYATIHSRTVG